MKDKRKDPGYRKAEREKDRIRRKQVREENSELRDRERQRDREYRQQVKNGERQIKSQKSPDSMRDVQFAENLTDSEPENCVTVENCFNCQDNVSGFLIGRPGAVIPGDSLLTVGDTESYEGSERSEQFDISIVS